MVHRKAIIHCSYANAHYIKRKQFSETNVTSHTHFNKFQIWRYFLNVSADHWKPCGRPHAARGPVAGPHLVGTLNSSERVTFRVISSHSYRAQHKTWTPPTVNSGASVSPHQRPHVVWLTAASQCFQIARIANLPTLLPFYCCVTMRRESRVHSECSTSVASLAVLRSNL